MKAVRKRCMHTQKVALSTILYPVIWHSFYQLAVRAVPYHKDFIAALKKDPSVSDEQLYEDMRASQISLKSNLDEINRFYTEKGQHSDQVV